MANNFSADSNCIAVYRFENGALTTDSKNSNTLTASASAPTSNTTTFKEGAGSAQFVRNSTQLYYITDAGLSSSFPLKSGTSNKTISACQWVYLSSLPGDGFFRILWAKYENSSGANRTLMGIIEGAAGVNTFSMKLGDTGGAFSQTVAHATNLSASTWYHATFTYNDSDKSYSISIRDASGNVVGSDVTGTATANIGLFSASDFMLGAFQEHTSPGECYDGEIDECVIFDDIISATEATQIAQGTYLSGTTITTGLGSQTLTGNQGVLGIGLIPGTMIAGT